MNPAEKEYRSMTKRLGVLLVLLLALLFLRSGVLVGFSLFELFLPTVAYDTAYQLLGGLLYALCFLIPVLVFQPISFGERVEPILFETKLPRNTPFYLFAGLSVLITAAAINSYMLSFLDYSSFSEDFFVPIETVTGRQIVLQLLTVAVIPAFVEELLFRGVILTNLLPYGRTNAVVASALLFGLMHQNAEQFFFATVAGLVFGFLYLKLRTVWAPVLLHFINNFYAIFAQVLAERLPADRVDVMLMILQTAIFAAGIVSLIYLMRKEGGETVEEKPILAVTPKRRLRLFCSVPMLVFCVLCVLQIVLYLVLAAVWY